MLSTLAYEILMALVWIPTLRSRGWRLFSVTLPWSFWDFFRGTGLWVASTVAYYTVWILFATKFPISARNAAALHSSGSASWWSVGMLSLINPLAEEFLYLGFLANALHLRSGTLALWTSVLVRVAVHLYQGPLAFLSILPVGFVFTWYYLESGRIWPVVVAHSLSNFYALWRFIDWAA